MLMPDQSPTKQTWWRNKNVLGSLVGAGGFVLLTLLGHTITRWADPYITQLLNGTTHSKLDLLQINVNWTNSQLISLGFAAVVIGLTASWLVNRAQDKTKEAESEFKKVEARAKQDIEAVYRSSHEILQSEQRRFEQEIDSTRADGLYAIQEAQKSCRNQIKEERKESKRLLEDEKEKYAKEVADLVDLCKKLNNQLGKDNKIKQEKRLTQPNKYDFLSSEAITKQIHYQADVILDITTPEDLLFNEATETLKKYDK